MSALLLLLGAVLPTQAPCSPCGSFLAQPEYCLPCPLKGPFAHYAPQPGDIFLATDQDFLSRLGHALAGGAGVHHSGILFRRSNGRMAVLEAGPFNTQAVEALDPFEHMNNHVQAGDRVWIRQRLTPLTPQQSQALTEYAERQVGKPFASLRVYGQLTPFRSRGPIKTYFAGKPKGDREDFFCSELVIESAVAAGLVDAATARPSATYPRDLFFGRSQNPFLNRFLRLEESWQAPARWLPKLPEPTSR